MRHSIRQADLAKRLGYEQSYISALEAGLKGPPTQDFIERLISALELTAVEQAELQASVEASQRKLTLDPAAPADLYYLFKDLRDKLDQLAPVHIRMIRDVLSVRPAVDEPAEPMRRLKRRRKEEATM